MYAVIPREFTLFLFQPAGLIYSKNSIASPRSERSSGCAFDVRNGCAFRSGIDRGSCDMLHATDYSTPMKKEYIKAILVLLAVCVMATGCSKLIHGKAIAENAIAEFHGLLDEGNFDEIYAASDQRMKDEVSQEDMIKVFNAVHSKLGAVKNSTNQNWSVKSFNLTTYIEMIQDTEFESGKGTEKFTYFFIDDDKVLLGGYYINSIDLITN
jgi:hypothetical protein